MPADRPATRRYRQLRLAGAVLAALAAPGLPAAAEQFTTAEEVKPMLDFTRADWVALRELDGQDQLLFTHVLGWRCGIDRISYAINGGQRKRLEVEPCYEGETRPNALKSKTIMPFVTFPAGSVESVTVWLTYDDGSTDKEVFKRKAILSR